MSGTGRQRPFTARGAGWSPIQPISRPGPHLPWTDWTTKRRNRFFRTVGGGFVALVLVIVVATKCGGGDETVGTGGTTTTTTIVETPTQPLTTITAALSPAVLPGPTYQGPATAVGETIVMMGGINEDTQSTRKVWQFDPATGETKNIAALATGTNNGASASIGTDVFLFGGGARNSIFDTIDRVAVGANRQSLAGTLPSPRTEAVAVTDPESGAVYLVGGAGPSGAQLEVLSTTDGVTFEVVTTLAEPVRAPAVAIQGGSIWIFGGRWDDTTRASIQRIDLATATTTVVGQMEAPLSNAMAFTLGDQVYVAGGRTPAGRSNEVRRLDQAAFTLSGVATLPANLSDAGVAVIGQTAYLLGGLGGDTDVATNQIVTVTLG